MLPQAQENGKKIVGGLTAHKKGIEMDKEEIFNIIREVLPNNLYDILSEERITEEEVNLIVEDLIQDIDDNID